MTRVPCAREFIFIYIYTQCGVFTVRISLSLGFKQDDLLY